MANTYTQITIHIVFTVKHRENLIKKQHREELYKYIAGIIQNKNQKLLAINGASDHIHILVGLNPAMSISNLVRDIKNNSSKFINKKRWVLGKFQWQEGYGAFSYSRSQRPDIIKYINNQEEHHQKLSFKDEYLNILKKFDVNYDDEYLFDFFE
ncbi:MAG: IS200/IS605 family transposase [Bacteroidota bacterium]|nr:IS200/IS605 family transposase [Bacteroidota bacterium]